MIRIVAAAAPFCTLKILYPTIPLIRGLGFNRVVVAEHGIKHESQQWGADHALEVDQFAYVSNPWRAPAAGCCVR